jgi:hypothetical protein
MHFHDDATLRNQLTRFGHNEEVRRNSKRMTSEEFRSFFLNRIAEEMPRSSPGSQSLQLLEKAIALEAEETWVRKQRPFYNVWPIAEHLARDVRLDLPVSAVEIPFEAMLLRFALGHEPYSVTTAMLFWPKNRPNVRPNVNVQCYFPGTMDRLTFRYDYDPQDTVEAWLEKMGSDTQTSEWRSMEQTYKHADPSAAPLMVRLVVFIGLLANNQDMITPIVLAKDRTQYESTNEKSVKEWLEKRAIRKIGRGFDVGKQLQAERDSSPHWRNPHLCLFWTGPGRTKPVIRMRSGSVVQRVGMASVPTGYLGPERQEEDAESGTFVYFAEAVGQERIKIGRADNPEARVTQLQTGSAVELRLLGVVAGPSSLEAELHAAFANDRIQGEWFHATAELREYISRVAQSKC